MDMTHVRPNNAKRLYLDSVKQEIISKENKRLVDAVSGWLPGEGGECGDWVAACVRWVADGWVDGWVGACSECGVCKWVGGWVMYVADVYYRVPPAADACVVRANVPLMSGPGRA